MGNTQCGSITDDHKTLFLLIEEALKGIKHNKSSFVYEEYKEIKLDIYNKRKNRFNDNHKLSSYNKTLCGNIPIEKRKKIYIEWCQPLVMNNNILRLGKEIDLDLLFTNHLKDLVKNDKKLFDNMLASSPPNKLRHLTWMTSANIKPDKNVFDYYLNEDLDGELDKQIKKDLNRTFFSSESSEATKENLTKLYNVLYAIANQDREIGYCQGMNFIAKFLLQVTSFNELNSFALFSHILTEIKGCFTANFPLLYSNINIFNHHFEKFMPRLKKHFDSLDLLPELWIGKWLQTLYTICSPYELTCRIWDTLFAYGLDFIIPLSLSIIKSFERDLMKLTDTSDVIEYFNQIFFGQTDKIPTYDTVSHCISIDKVIDYAVGLHKDINDYIEDYVEKQFESVNDNSNDLWLEKDYMSPFKKSISLVTRCSTLSSMSKIEHKVKFIEKDDVTEKYNGGELSDNDDEYYDNIIEGKPMNYSESKTVRKKGTELICKTLTFKNKFTNPLLID